MAYNSLLLERRRVVHERAAQALETLFADRLEERYNELAHHYSRSGNTAQAVDYLQRAGQQVGATPQLFAALMGIGTFYMASGRLQAAHELREQLLALAQRQQDPALLLHAHLGLWSCAPP